LYSFARTHTRSRAHTRRHNFVDLINNEQYYRYSSYYVTINNALPLEAAHAVSYLFSISYINLLLPLSLSIVIVSLRFTLYKISNFSPLVLRAESR